ncbi:CPBP family intramembrane glutamic endopeptidase [Streptomyces sp. NPDC003314]
MGEFFLVLGLMVAGAIFVFVGSAVIGLLLDLEWAADDGDGIFADPLVDNAVLLMVLASWIPAVLVAVRVCGKRPAGTLASVTGRLRWGWLGWCFGLAAVVLVLQNLVLIFWSLFQDGSEMTSGKTPGWAELFLSLLVLWALVPFQAAAEEFVFRGWLVQLFGGFLRSPWPGVAVASLLFALAHGFGELSGFLLLCYSAAWWGWLTIRTGGLEAVIAVHTVNNLIAFSVSAVFGELADDSTAADAPWEAFAAELVFAPVFCLAVARLARRRGVVARTPLLPA